MATCIACLDKRYSVHMADFIEYDGVRWHPNDNDPYYRNSRRGLLHRWMWVTEVGPIPTGMQVHHKNHDKRDNRITNFVLLTPGKHWAEHGEERGPDWHSLGGHATWERAQYRTFVCERCGESFESRAAAGARYCSPRCREAGAPSRALEQRVCCLCGGSFECQARNATRTCSRRCTSIIAYQSRRSRLRSDG